jgi:hypothetical protein
MPLMPDSGSNDELKRTVLIGLNAVIVAVTDEEPRLLTVQPPRNLVADSKHQGQESGALPFGPLDPERDRTLERGLDRWVKEQTGLELGYVEQLYTFGDRDREPRGRRGGRRVLSVGYVALVREGQVAGREGTRWRPWYEYFPWEDWRNGRPALIEAAIEPALDRWVEGGADPLQRRARRERTDITFGLRGAPWDGERVLERYELLYEAGLIYEALRDAELSAAEDPSAGTIGRTQPRLVPGRSMVLDHRRIVATAMGRLRGKIRYRPVVFELLPASFTYLQLQRLVEALAGVRLHKQNFRRLVEKGGLVEGTGQLLAHTGGRPAELFRFRREVLRERPTPGVGLPGVHSWRPA